MRKIKAIKINIVFIIIVVFIFLCLIFKLVWVGTGNVMVKGETLASFASKRHTVKKTIYAKRGTIYSSGGEVLAKDVNSYTVIAYLEPSRTKDMNNPYHVVDKELTAKKLSPLINMTEERIIELLSLTYNKCDEDNNCEISPVYQVELGPGGRGITQLLKEQIEEFLQNIPDTSITIFWMDGIELSNKKGKWAIDIFTKYATAVNFAKAEGRELRKILCAYASKNGCTMNDGTASYLIELAGDSLNVLFNEIQKACNFAGQGNEITREHIDSVAVRSLEAKVFDLSKLILNHNAQGALELLHTLMMQKAEPIDIFGVILTAFVDIYRVKTSVTAGETVMYPAKIFDYKNKDFRLTNSNRFAKNLTDEQIRECFDCFSEADKALKSSAQSGELILEKLIVHLSLIIAR
mgnify:CR=1 FL=1